MLTLFAERVNSIIFALIGYISPVLVSVVSFYVYIAQGNELTIGTAFTVGVPTVFFRRSTLSLCVCR